MSTTPLPPEPPGGGSGPSTGPGPDGGPTTSTGPAPTAGPGTDVPPANQPPPAASGRTPGSGADGFFDAVRRVGIARSDDRWIGGVAAGVAERFGIDPLLVRGILFVTFFLSGAGLVLYGAAWALLPERRDGRIHLQEAVRGNFDVAMLGAIASVVVGLSWGGGWWSWWDYLNLGWLTGLFWVAAIVVVAVVAVSVLRRDGDRGGPGGPGWSGPQGGPGWSGPQGGAGWSRSGGPDDARPGRGLPRPRPCRRTVGVSRSRLPRHRGIPPGRPGRRRAVGRPVDRARERAPHVGAGAGTGLVRRPGGPPSGSARPSGPAAAQAATPSRAGLGDGRDRRGPEPPARGAPPRRRAAG
ncbi:PspC domain-containing protein [Cellulosimicrobium sp. Marseille-Q8652]